MLLAFSNLGHSQKTDIYCFGSYDEYRQMKYWATRSVSLNDYKFQSGDARYLKLTVHNAEAKRDEPIKELVDHFNKEFLRILKGNLPFHDVEEGRNKRFKEAWDKHGQSDKFFEIWQAQEEARRKSLYGPDPGAVYCLIAVNRREFPVLYEMKTSVVANKALRNYENFQEKDIGFSTPDLIIGELKQTMTSQLEELADHLKRMRNCPKKSSP
jgi:hypothetical protein